MEITVSVLKDLGEALKAAGQALEGFIKAIGTAVASAAEGYDHWAARRDRGRLVRLSANLTNLGSEWNQRVVDSIDAYLAKQQPTMYDWAVVVSGLDLALKEVTSILTDIKKERSEFVLHPAYVELSAGLHARTQILEKLQWNEQPPTTREQLQELALVNEQYKILIVRLREAVKVMNVYLGEEYYNNLSLSDGEMLKYVS